MFGVVSVLPQWLKGGHFKIQALYMNSGVKLRCTFFVCFFVFHAGLHSPCPHNHLPVLPLCCNSDNLPIPKEKNDGFMEKEKKNEHERGTGQEKKTENTSFGSQNEQQQRFFPPSRGLFQGNTSTLMSSPGLTGSNLNMEISRRRIFSLEPFHQSSIINSRLKRGREEDREEEMEVEEGTENLSKKAKFTNGKNSESLHVCDFVLGCWILLLLTHWSWLQRHLWKTWRSWRSASSWMAFGSTSPAYPGSSTNGFPLARDQQRPTGSSEQMSHPSGRGQTSAKAGVSPRLWGGMAREVNPQILLFKLCFISWF